MAAAQSPLQELANALAASSTFQLRSDLELPGDVLLAVLVGGYNNGGKWFGNATFTVLKGNFTGGVQSLSFTTIDDIMRQVARRYPGAVARPESVKVSAKGPITGTKAQAIAIQAWHEVYGRPIPTLDEVAKLRKESKAATKTANVDTIGLLKTGAAGVEAFNERSHIDRLAVDFRKVDLSGCELSGIQFARVTKLHEAALTGAKLVKSSLFACKCTDADLSNADLTGADLRHASFLRATLKGANLTDAELFGADLRGADLQGATVAGCTFDGATFDEQTKWPKKFKIPEKLVWKGAGPDPRLAPTKKEKKLPSPTDFAGFLERLELATDKSKLDKAMKMLKAERFRLFAKVEPDQLVGVVKSQSDPTLVYSCRIGSDGKYACCTQNLNVCGGLRGSPCKHLLVLIVGLAKAGELDPSTAHEWSQASRGQKPELDKDAMTETLLQYKGAEAGEVDWRPTETIPEDFYAL